jgi:hypothetical protein
LQTWLLKSYRLKINLEKYLDVRFTFDNFVTDLQRNTMETTYKGFKIKEVFTFTNGKSDWVITPPNEEYGKTFPEATVEDVMRYIDDKLED